MYYTSSITEICPIDLRYTARGSLAVANPPLRVLGRVALHLKVPLEWGAALIPLPSPPISPFTITFLPVPEDHHRPPSITDKTHLPYTQFCLVKNGFNGSIVSFKSVYNF